MKKNRNVNKNGSFYRNQSKKIKEDKQNSRKEIQTRSQDKIIAGENIAKTRRIFGEQAGDIRSENI